MRLDDHRIAVHSDPTGGSLVLRWPSAVALLSTPEAATVNSLQAELGDTPEAGEVIEALRRHLAADTTTSVAAVVETTGGAWALLRGAVEIHGTATRLAGTAQLAEQQLADPEVPLTLQTTGAVLPPVPDLLDLRAGVVAASAAWVTTNAVAAPPLPPEAETAPAPLPTSFDFVDLRDVADVAHAPALLVASSEASAAAEASVETPVVHGILCSRSHFNNPQAAYCMVCGISMVHLTHNLVPGPRPTLGFMVFDDGSTYTLDRSYLLGREPGEVADRTMVSLAVPDDRQTVSRRHAEVRLDDWNVTVVDLGSTNGSFLWNAALARWDPLTAHQPVSLAPGAIVAVGRRTFVYESVHRV